MDEAATIAGNWYTATYYNPRRAHSLLDRQTIDRAYFNMPQPIPAEKCAIPAMRGMRQMSPLKLVIGLVLCLSLPVHAAAETCIMVADTEGTPTPTMMYDGSLYTLEPAFEDYSYMLFDACDAWGATIDTGCDIYPMMGAIKWNAVATICDGNKVIVYDRRIGTSIGYEGAQAVIAHELGHHLCNHLGVSKNETGESHRQELEADRFAGATLRRIGFSRAAALTYLPLLMEQPSLSHPSKAEREAALLAGWDDPGSGLKCLP